MSTVFVGWAATEASALISLAGVDSTKASVYYQPFVNQAGMVTDGAAWVPPSDAPLGGGLEVAAASNLFIGGTTSPPTNPSFTLLGGTGHSWGLSVVVRVKGLPLVADNYLLIMLGLVTGAGLSVGLYQNVNATHFSAGVTGSGGTSYLSTVVLDENFHRLRMWYNATTDKYFFAADTETAVQIVTVAPLTAGTRCPVVFMAGGTKSYCLNRFLFVSGSEV